MQKKRAHGRAVRPCTDEIRLYRTYVDEHVLQLLERNAGHQAVADLVILGLHHERQHQEWLLAEVEHLFSCHP